MSVENLITEHLDIWTSAIKTKSAAGRGSSKKLDLVGVKKLRELILELAVRGKLVPQDPNDEPASELLKKVEAEKVRLVKEGKIKKQKPLAPITGEEKPFELPNNWAFSKLGDFVYVEMGQSPPSKFYNQNNDGLPFFQGKADFGAMYPTARYWCVQPQKYAYDGDVLLSVRAPVGPTNIANIECCIGRGLSALRPLCHVPTNYVYYMMHGFRSNLESFATGTTFVAVSKVNVDNLVVSIPPLAEQHRIVAKVDELMALCDQLEAQTEASLGAHKILVEVLLATLTDAKDAIELNDNWQTISQHFDLLLTTQASIDQLKQTILQLAVMGKLVKQDPKDEPAAKLLERIATEKQQLIKDGKIKKQKPLPPITDEEKPFALPSGWGLTRLDDICFGITSGSTPPKDKFNETTGVPYLKVYNIKEQSIAFNYRPQFVDVQHHKDKLTRSILYPGDVVMNIVGPPLGKIAIIPDDYPEWNCNQAIVFFRPIETSLNSYIYTYLTSGRFLDAIELIGTAGQDNISVTKSRSIIFPMPPLAEQHRIVAKVEELMALCDSLKAKLNQAQTTQLHLTDAIVEQVL